MRAMLLPVWVGKGSRAEKLCMHEALAECVRRWCGVAGIGSRVPDEDALGRRMGGCGGWVFCAEGLRYMKCVSAFKSAVSRYSDRTMRGLCCGVLLLRMSKQGAIAEPHPNRPRHPPDLQSSWDAVHPASVKPRWRIVEACTETPCCTRNLDTAPWNVTTARADHERDVKLSLERTAAVCLPTKRSCVHRVRVRREGRKLDEASTGPFPSRGMRLQPARESAA
jgi:hypothetical protein